MGGPLGTANLALGVGFARVYFHCNWLGDVICGLFCGTGIGAFIIKLKTKALFKTFYMVYLQNIFAKDGVEDEF